MALIGILGFASVTIYLQTTSGQLVIESEIDDIQVTVLKDEQPLKHLTIDRTAESTRLRIGKYRVVIKGKSDGMVIRNGVFEIKRGETIVARITKSEDKNEDKPTDRLEIQSNELASENDKALQRIEVQLSELISEKPKVETEQAETQKRISKLEPNQELNQNKKELMALYKKREELLNVQLNLAKSIGELENEFCKITQRKRRSIVVELKHSKNESVAQFLKALYQQHFVKKHGPVRIEPLNEIFLTLSGSESAIKTLESLVGVVDVDSILDQRPNPIRLLFPDNKFLESDSNPKIPHPDFDALTNALQQAIPRDSAFEEFDRFSRLLMNYDEGLKTYYPFGKRKALFFSDAKIIHHASLREWYSKIHVPFSKMFQIQDPFPSGAKPMPFIVPANMKQPGWTIKLIGHHFHNRDEDLVRIDAAKPYLLNNLMRPLLTGEHKTSSGREISFEDFGILYPTVIESSERSKRMIEYDTYREEVFNYNFAIEFAWIPRTEAQQLEAKKARLDKESAIE